MSGCNQGCGATEIFVSSAPAPAPGKIGWLLVAPAPALAIYIFFSKWV